MTDDFNGDTPHLVRCIEALLNLDEAGSLVPHRLPGHARMMLSAAACRLSARPEPQAALSEEEIAELSLQFVRSEPLSDFDYVGFARAVLAASRQVPVGWASVRRDGMPPCDDETLFVGINTAGFSCCFNEVTHDGVCSMRGPELSTVQMSALEWWRVLDRPSPLPVGEPRQEEGERSGGVMGEFGDLDALDREVDAIRASDGVREAALRRAGAAGLLPDPDVVGVKTCGEPQQEKRDA